MSHKPKTETHISRPMVLAAVILVGLAIAFVVYTAGRLGTRLDETAYHNMTSYAQQSASGINKMKTAYTSLCPIITVEANWRENRADTLRDMKSLMAGYEITSLCFIGDDGTGFDALRRYFAYGTGSGSGTIRYEASTANRFAALDGGGVYVLGDGEGGDDGLGGGDSVLFGGDLGDDAALFGQWWQSNFQ